MISFTLDHFISGQELQIKDHDVIAQIWGLTYIQIILWSKFKLYKVIQNYESSAEATSLLSLVVSLAITYFYNYYIGH